jgi:uncharacterized Tic20 family protein
MDQVQTQLPPSNVSESDRMWAASAHLLALVLALLTSWVAGIAGVVGALVVWMIKRDDSSFAAAHAKEAINFNLSMFLYACAAVVIGFLLLGATIFTLGLGLILTAPAGILLALAVLAIAVMWLVCSVIAIFKAYNGESYRYPLTIRLLG